jgi:hypothetical protein
VKAPQNRVPIDFLLTGGVPGDGVQGGVWFPDPEAASVEIAGRRYLALARLVELKLVSGLSAPDRPRDLDDVIQVIRKNGLGEHFGDHLHP